MPGRRDRDLAAPDELQVIAAARREAAELAGGPGAVALPADCAPGYTLIREIGQGGMGVVYEAHQHDPPRAVAVKIMSLAGAVDEERFRLEIEALARITHPNIAAIYRTGRTTDGRPFFAMELVHGVPLTEYARLKRLSLREQVRLFRRVCEAVHYVHRCGRAHRDLKPQNILIDGEGNPKIVDFGLAWFAGAVGPVRASSAGAGTVRYMSPEQRRGDRDVPDMFATDVYTLGLILYELLTGHVPEDGDDGHGAVWRRPSTYRRELRGELDRIIGHAMEREPAARYPSPGALADDLERHLAYLPISIIPQTTGYVLRKLAARHKVAITFVLTLIVVVTGFAIETSGLYIQLSVAREISERVRQQNQQQTDGLSDRLRLAELRDADRLERQGEIAFNEEEFSDAAGMFHWCMRIRQRAGDDPRRIAWTQSQLGACLTRLKQFVEAEELLKGSYETIAATRGRQHELTREVARRLASLYDAWDKPEDAALWRSRAAPVSSAPMLTP